MSGVACRSSAAPNSGEVLRSAVCVMDIGEWRLCASFFVVQEDMA